MAPVAQWSRTRQKNDNAQTHARTAKRLGRKMEVKTSCVLPTPAVKGTLQFYRRACPVLNVNGADLRPSHAPRRHLTPRIEPCLLQ
jgi:hypothetical protein